MKIYIENQKFWNHITYSFETILRCIQIKDYEFEKYEQDSNMDFDSILYSSTCPEHYKGIFIKQGKLFSEMYLKEASIPSLPLKRFEDIPVFFCDELVPEKKRKTYRLEYNWDIVQGVFFLVSGYEEIIDSFLERDEFSRPFIKDRIVYKEKLLYKPIVNIYAELLKNDIKALNYPVKMIQHPPMAHISHDVDLPYEVNMWRYALNKLNKVFLKKEWKYPISKGFSYVLDTEKKNDIKSSWYFIVGGNNPSHDNDYDIYDESIRKVLKEILHNGDEIGWHYSFNAAYDKYLMQKEAISFSNRFENVSRCGRNHYLRYCIPESWREYEKCEIVYDTTLASPYHEGFVFGICTPFQLFDAVNGNKLDVWEIPLLVMEATLRYYRNMDVDTAINSIKELMNITCKYNGVFSILWHNSSINNNLWKKWRRAYDDTMKEISINFGSKTGFEILESYR